MKYIPILLLSFFLLNCKKECCEDLVTDDRVWVVDYIQMEDQQVVAPHDVTFRFKSDSTFLLRLNSNTCDGQFTVSEENVWTATSMGCTYKCCDSEFSSQVINIIREAVSMNRKGRKLMFTDAAEQVVFVRE